MENEKEKKIVGIRLDPQKYEAFKMHCREQHISVNQAIEALMTLSVNQNLKFKKHSQTDVIFE